MYLQRHILNIWIPKLFFIYLESVSQPEEISTEADFIEQFLKICVLKLITAGTIICLPRLKKKKKKAFKGGNI